MIGAAMIPSAILGLILVALGALSAALGRRVAGIGLGAAGALVLLGEAAQAGPDGARLALVGGVVLTARAILALEAK
jgi:hypothetical protein